MLSNILLIAVAELAVIWFIASATALICKSVISPVEYVPDDLFVKINFKMKIGNLIDSTIIQLYPFDLAHSIYKLFQRRK